MNCSTFEDFLTLKNWIEKKSDELVLSEKTKKQLLIAADEVFTNIVSYSGVAKASVEFDASERRLTLTFSDSGMPFNPLEVPPPNVSLPLAERKIGGLGVFMVKKIMDTVEYRRENDTNVLVMTKHDF